MFAFHPLRLVLGLALALAATAAHAGDLVVEVKSPKGAPVADAVVTVDPAGGGKSPARYDQPLALTQQHLMFLPFVLVVPVGGSVSFPNADKVRHQVYSFSAAKRFELKLYGQDQSRAIVFDKVGTVAVGCNIHDSMAAFIKVVDAPFATHTDAQGRAVIKDIGAGAAVVRVWHPYAKVAGGEVKLEVAIPVRGAAQKPVVLDVRAPPMVMAGG